MKDQNRRRRPSNLYIKASPIDGISISPPNSALLSFQALPMPPSTPSTPVDVRPRLTRPQHDILEQHFLSERKPNTVTKKGIALALNVPLEKINNWFQNRRAKAKLELRKAANLSIRTPSATAVVFPAALPTPALSANGDGESSMWRSNSDSGASQSQPDSVDASAQALGLATGSETSLPRTFEVRKEPPSFDLPQFRPPSYVPLTPSFSAGYQGSGSSPDDKFSPGSTPALYSRASAPTFGPLAFGSGYHAAPHLNMDMAAVIPLHVPDVQVLPMAMSAGPHTQATAAYRPPSADPYTDAFIEHLVRYSDFETYFHTFKVDNIDNLAV